MAAGAPRQVCCRVVPQMKPLEILRPDDWHVHLRDGASLKAVLKFTAHRFARAIVMPNLKPAVTTADLARAYRGRNSRGASRGHGIRAADDPLLTHHTTPKKSTGPRPRVSFTA